MGSKLRLLRNGTRRNGNSTNFNPMGAMGFVYSVPVVIQKKYPDSGLKWHQPVQPENEISEIRKLRFLFINLNTCDNV